ncbi:protein kinase domain-containing protein [Streptomyces sp. OZ13]|uniref:serine/threonine-protein kinase n=1 Tax=Streptomyces sp. OZ13 TaxID=3452210 RepID=UPI003F898B87
MTHDDPVEIAGHRLLARLGHGGMGTVYLARTSGGRVLALKTMHAAIATDPTARTRFHLETDAARIIGDHHGATVVDADPTAETPWLATEYVLGPPLDDAVGLCGPLPEASVRAIGAALAGALTQLHTSDVVHRDLKPSNVMITAYGPKIIDFGIARAAGDDRLTRTGAAAGTPAYMSPEQATGQEHAPAGDTFALAGVLVYAATGRPPFGSGQAADLLYRIRYTEPDLTGLPPALAPVLSRCLGKDPAERPTTGELAAQLHDGQGQFADHLPHTLLTDIARRATDVWAHHPHRLPEPAHTPPITETAAGRATVSRRTLLKRGGGTAAGAIALGAGIWAWLDNRGTSAAEDTAAPSPASEVPKLPGSVWTRGISRNSQEVDTAPLLAGDCLAITTVEGLIGVDVATGEDRWLRKEMVSASAVTTDGRRIYAITPDPSELTLCTVDLADGSLELVLVLDDFNSALKNGKLLCVSDGTAFLVAGQGETDARATWYLVAADVSSGEELWRSELGPLENPVLKSFYSARSLAGSFLMTVGDSESEARLECYDAATGAFRWAVKPDAPLVAGIVMDERHVYLGANTFGLSTERHQVIAVRLTDGRTVWEYGEDVPQDLPHPVLGGDVLYTMRFGGIVTMIDAAEGSLVWESSPVPDRYGVAFVGEQHLYIIGKSGLEVIDIRTRRTRNTVTMPQDARYVRADNGMFVAVQTDVIAGYSVE